MWCDDDNDYYDNDDRNDYDEVDNDDAAAADDGVLVMVTTIVVKLCCYLPHTFWFVDDEMLKECWWYVNWSEYMLIEDRGGKSGYFIVAYLNLHIHIYVRRGDELIKI